MNYYHWFEAFHIISVIMWMAGMLYLPRLYVYHTTVESASENDRLLQIMERRLLKYIINPSMFLSLSFGFILTFIKGVYYEGWFHMKVLALFFMFVIYVLLVMHRKSFAMGSNKKTHVYFRILNEMVTVLIIIIVIMVVVKPF